MGLYFKTQEDLDQAIGNGGVIGMLDTLEADGDIPRAIGDWSIRLAPSDQRNKTVIVAVPTNSRTREIYHQGRHKWLLSLGYNDQLAGQYIKASAGVMYRWEEVVARFVLANIKMDTETWYDIKEADNPLEKAQSFNIEVAIARSRLQAAMGILMNIWELPPKA